MTDLLNTPLVLVTGKGGTGKSTVAAALGHAAAARGLRTVVCEVGSQSRMPALLGRPGAAGDGEQQIDEKLWTVSVDPDEALKAWLANQLGSRSVASVLTRSNLFSYLAAAAPGVKELVTVTRLWELAQQPRWDDRHREYDIVIGDLPATGHALGMLRTPRTFTDIARIGPLAGQARAVAEVLEDAGRSTLLAVTLPGELPVSETLELQHQTHDTLGRGLDAIVANGVLARRWTAAEAAELDGAGGRRAHVVVSGEAARIAGQQAQLRRLRRGAHVPVLSLPHVAAPVLTAADVRALGAALVTRSRGGRASDRPRASPDAPAR